MPSNEDDAGDNHGQESREQAAHRQVPQAVVVAMLARSPRRPGVGRALGLVDHGGGGV